MKIDFIIPPAICCVTEIDCMKMVEGAGKKPYRGLYCENVPVPVLMAKHVIESRRNRKILIKTVFGGIIPGKYGNHTIAT